MATLHVEFGLVALKRPNGSSIHGNAVYYEALAISVSAATGAAATAVQVGNADMVARLSTDTFCFFAVGSAPDPTATAATGATSAKRVLPAGSGITVPITAGQKISVIAG